MQVTPKQFFSSFCKAAVFALLLCGVAIAQLNALAAETKDSAGNGTGPKKAGKKTGASTEELTDPQAPTAQNSAALLTFNLNPALLSWTKLEEGMELLELGLERSQVNGAPVLHISAMSEPADLIILRVNPKFYEFTLHMASEDGQLRSLAEQARLNNLSAAINAGMYLPDHLTSTGYMQSATHTNNPHIASKFGIFFVAGPKGKALAAALVEKADLGDNPIKTLSHYKIVVQNFRLVSANGQVLWPESANVHSISALAQDAAGNILLILCRSQLSPADFGRLLLALPLECGPVMYLEGGGQAGLLLRLPEGGQAVWRGKHNLILTLDGAADAPIPNIIGLRPVAKAIKAEKTHNGPAR